MRQLFQKLNETCAPENDERCVDCCSAGAKAAARPRPPVTCAERGKFCQDMAARVEVVPGAGPDCSNCNFHSFIIACRSADPECVGMRFWAQTTAVSENACAAFEREGCAACCVRPVSVASLCPENPPLAFNGAVGATSAAVSTTVGSTNNVSPTSVVSGVLSSSGLASIKTATANGPTSAAATVGVGVRRTFTLWCLAAVAMMVASSTAQ